MATGNRERVHRPGAGTARVILRGSPQLMTVRARGVRMLGGDVSTGMQERPSLAFGLLVALLGAILAARQAGLFTRRRTIRQRLHQRRRQLRGALDLPSVAVKLLANPLVRDYVRRAVLREVSRRWRR